MSPRALDSHARSTRTRSARWLDNGDAETSSGRMSNSARTIRPGAAVERDGRAFAIATRPLACGHGSSSSLAD